MKTTSSGISRRHLLAMGAALPAAGMMSGLIRPAMAAGKTKLPAHHLRLVLLPVERAGVAPCALVVDLDVAALLASAWPGEPLAVRGRGRELRSDASERDQRRELRIGNPHELHVALGCHR